MPLSSVQKMLYDQHAIQLLCTQSVHHSSVRQDSCGVYNLINNPAPQPLGGYAMLLPHTTWRMHGC